MLLWTVDCGGLYWKLSQFSNIFDESEVGNFIFFSQMLNYEQTIKKILCVSWLVITLARVKIRDLGPGQQHHDVNIFQICCFRFSWSDQQHFLEKRNESNWPKINDHTIGWQNLSPLSHPNATLAPQARHARASGKNLKYVTLAT